jgi:very-short-patch-repair endonuclease
MLTKKELQKLQADGKIRSFSSLDLRVTSKGAPVKKLKKKRSKGLDYLSWNIPHWCKIKELKMEQEYHFNPEREWRFDFAIPDIKVAVEFEGGIFIKNSGHNTAKHYTKDAEKYNSAAILGWRVLRFTALDYKNLIPDLNKCL